MSLRETYQSRKNLLAANLTQQGVTASGSEGLTTLINKVLEISPAPPTPVLDHFDVELVDGKKILSYADEQQTPYSQFASLLFTAYDSNDDPIPGLEFDFSVTGESTVSAVCDNSGEYVYTYYSQGIGDVEITASKEVSGMVVSKTYGIKDWIKYDDCSTDKTSDYNVQTGSSFTFDTDHYIMSGSDSAVEVASNLDKVQFEVLLKHNNNAGGIMIQQDPSTFGTNSAGLYNNASNITYIALFPWQNVKSQNNVTNNSDYYRYILTIDGSSITARIENASGTSLFSGTTSKSLSEKHYCLFTPANSMNVKEIIIKPL